MIRKFFVYGTLCSGEQRNHIFGEGKRIPGDFKVTGQLYSLGAFPALVLSDEGELSLVLSDEGEVVGEVYEVPEDERDHFIRLLDVIEGVDFGLYERTVTTARNGEEEHECYVYVAGPELQDELTHLISSGSWRNRND